MFSYDKTFDPEVFLGHCDLISWFSDFAFYLGTQLVYDQTSFTLCLRMTFDSKVVIGHDDLISRFSDFPLYIGTQIGIWGWSFLSVA